MQPPTDAAQRDILKWPEMLLLCQRELAQVREDQEPLQEQCSRLRVESSAAHAVSAELARVLADNLSRTFWEDRQPPTRIPVRRFISSHWPWLRKFFGNPRSTADLIEDEQIRLIEASVLFQPAWYLQRHIDVALAGINPATHYLRSGAQEGRDPGPDFSTRGYLARHPELEQGASNPLIHYLQSQPDPT